MDNYAQWRNVTSTKLSHDGNWVTYDYRKPEADEDAADERNLQIKHLASDKIYQIPFAISPAFSDDSRWIAYRIDLDRREAKKLKEQKKLIQQKVQLLNLKTGDKVTWENASSFVYSNSSNALAIRKPKTKGAKHAGSDLIKIMATGGVMTPGVNPEDAHYSAEEMNAGVGEAKRFHKTSASHAQGSEGIMNAVNAGITSIEHGIFMDEQCLEAMLERGTYLVPTLAAVQNILNNADKGIADYVLEKSRRVFEIHRESFTMFYKAGGKIAMGTDAGTPFNLHGENAMEMSYMVDCGMTATDALTSSTSVAHSLMELDDRGQIKADFKADMIIVNGNPTEDILMAANAANHRMVVKNGKVVDLA